MGTTRTAEEGRSGIRSRRRRIESIHAYPEGPKRSEERGGNERTNERMKKKARARHGTACRTDTYLSLGTVYSFPLFLFLLLLLPLYLYSRDRQAGRSTRQRQRQHGFFFFFFFSCSLVQKNPFFSLNLGVRMRAFLCNTLFDCVE